MRKSLLLASVLVAATSASAFAAGDAEMGKRQFALCMACHNVDPKLGTKVGPNLHGLIGRKSASVPGFAYTDAMKKLNVTWDEPTLDKYLTKPMEMVPGTRMAFTGLSDPNIRANIIAYLVQATK